MKNLARTAVAAALASVIAIPTAPIASPVQAGFSYSDAAVIEAIGWRGGKMGHRKGRGGGHGGGGHWGGGHNGGWHGGHHGGGGGHRGHHGGGHGGNHHDGGTRHDRPFYGFGFGYGFDDDYDDDYYFYAPRYRYDHVVRCAAAYQSYNPNTDMYRGDDGYWRLCRL